MCEQHSEFSPHQIERKAKKIRRRRMDPEIITRVTNDIYSHSSGRHLLKQVIPTTMGEPLQFKAFQTFIDLCTQHPALKLNITTNGSFIGNGVLRGVEAWAKVTCIYSYIYIHIHAYANIYMHVQTYRS
jgi:hypothetical protein